MRMALVSTELRVLSTEHWGKSHQILTADLRRWTPKEIPLRILPQRRPSIGLGTLSLSKGRGRRELTFCLSEDDDKQKTFLKLELKVFAQSSSPDWAKGISSAYSVSLR